MADKKLKDTEWKKVTVRYRDPENQNKVVRVGGNNLIINGKRELKQYVIRVGKEVELPVTFISRLKRRFEYRRDEEDNIIKVPILIVEEK